MNENSKNVVRPKSQLLLILIARFKDVLLLDDNLLVSKSSNDTIHIY